MKKYIFLLLYAISFNHNYISLNKIFNRIASSLKPFQKTHLILELKKFHNKPFYIGFGLTSIIIPNAIYFQKPLDQRNNSFFKNSILRYNNQQSKRYVNKNPNSLVSNFLKFRTKNLDTNSNNRSFQSSRNQFSRIREKLAIDQCPSDIHLMDYDKNKTTSIQIQDNIKNDVIIDTNPIIDNKAQLKKKYIIYDQDEFKQYIINVKEELIKNSPWYNTNYQTVEQLIAEAKKAKDPQQSLSDFLNLIKAKIVTDFNEKDYFGNHKYLDFEEDMHGKKILIFKKIHLQLIFKENLQKKTVKPFLDKKNFNWQNPQYLTPTSQLHNSFLAQYNSKNHEIQVNKLTYQTIKADGDGHCMYHSMDVNNDELIQMIEKQDDFYLNAITQIYTIATDSYYTQHVPTNFKNLIQGFRKEENIMNFHHKIFTQITEDINKNCMRLFVVIYCLFYDPWVLFENILSWDSNDFLYPIKQLLEKEQPQVFNQIITLRNVIKKNNGIISNKDLNDFSNSYNLLKCSNIFPVIIKLFDQIKQNKTKFNLKYIGYYNILDAFCGMINYNEYKVFLQTILNNSNRKWGSDNIMEYLCGLLQGLYKRVANVKPVSIDDEKQKCFIMIGLEGKDNQWGIDQLHCIKINDNFSSFYWDDFKKFNYILSNGGTHFDRLELIDHQEITDLYN